MVQAMEQEGSAEEWSQEAAEAGAAREVDAAGVSGQSKLDLSFRGLCWVPPAAAKLCAVQELDLRSNQLRGVPCEVLAGMPRLRHVNLSGNLLEELPSSVGALAELEHLDVSSNQLKHLPPSILNCRALTVLIATANHLQELPPELGQECGALEHVDVGYNELRALPQSLARLLRLRCLIARFNRLQAIPPALGQARALQHLDVSGNFVSLQSVPPELGALRELAFLDLSHNQISVLPLQLGRLSALQCLLLDGNPLVFPPLELLEEAESEAEGSEGGEQGTGEGAEGEGRRMDRVSGGGVDVERESKRRKRQCDVVVGFLGEKLRQWEEEQARRSVWGQLAGDWDLLSWLSTWLSSSPALLSLDGPNVPSASAPALEMASSAAPLPLSALPSYGTGADAEAEGDSAAALMGPTQPQPPLELSVQPQAGDTTPPSAHVTLIIPSPSAAPL